MAAAKLSHRYITDRFLPDKAIDLMDEATSRLAMELESVPGEIDEVQRRLTQLELAARQLAEETEEHAQDRLAEIQDEMAELQTQARQPARTMGSRKAGRRQRAQMCAASSTKWSSNIEQLQNRDQREASRAASSLAKKTIKSCSSSTTNAASSSRRRSRQSEPTPEPTTGRRLLRQEVGPEEIAEVVSAWTGIPVTRMMETERHKLLVLEERLHQRVVGQDEAVEAVSNAVRRSR